MVSGCAGYGTDNRDVTLEGYTVGTQVDYNDPSEVAAELERMVARAHKQVARGEATPRQAFEALRHTLGLRADSKLAQVMRVEVMG